MFNNKVILLTGGTGSFGKKFVSMTLKNFNPKKIIIFSRDEMKQWEMQKKYPNLKKLRFFLGDIRDKERLYRAFDNKIDVVVHAAALKIVPKAEYDPFEYVKTNILGSMNIINASIDFRVKKVVALSTDKASSPINLYGSTKLVSDKMFVSSNFYTNSDRTKFSVVRYGNVIGSRGSVIPYFLELNKQNSNFFPITHPEMTRFIISMEDGVRLVWKAVKDMHGGEIFVKKIPSIKVIDIAKSINRIKRLKIVGLRPGEKIHEELISKYEASNTYEFKEYYKILPSYNLVKKKTMIIKDGKKVPLNFEYNSKNNKDKLKNLNIKKNLD